MKIKYSFPDTSKIDKIFSKIGLKFIVYWRDSLKTFFNLRKNSKKELRFLEVGPGNLRIKNFETLNIVNSKETDYIVDFSRNKTPFSENSFDLIYCSHVLEHFPWYSVEESLKEFYRILKPGGGIEIWVPDAYKICKVLVDFEEKEIDRTELDGWYRFNEEKDPIKWTAGRIFTYGDGHGDPCHHNWHRGLFTEKYLFRLLEKNGFQNIELMNNREVRGFDHGWINLGVKAIK